ncbi:hypothetical protein O6H91_11G095100 [Diphasiastrum complanatum]|uniref:Uncharacterized protein n=1 Tax=Diphasiastrum complanatum TaxID=34168 RepID=A0ACC2CCS4_DIPCM|nr:hypothetical protein O6H91_11G095100 [Diphasiastrum complanatum]
MAEDLRDWWTRKQVELEETGHRKFVKKVFIPSPAELPAAASALDVKRDLNKERQERAHMCTQEGVRAGLKAGAIAGVVTAIPLVGVRVVPWAQKHLNYTAQALLISAASIAAYFIVSDQTILECARSSSYKVIEADRLKSSEQRP